MSQATTSEEYHHLLTAQRLILEALKAGDEMLSAKSQGTRALCDVIRLKRDMRGVPDPKPVDTTQVAKPRRARRPTLDLPPEPPNV